MGYLEGKPVFTLTYEGESKVCTPANTGAYVHADRFKDVDHIFRYNLEPGQDVDDYEIEEGIFVFRSLFGVVFNPLVRDMEELGFQVVYNEEPTKGDWQQYVQWATKDVNKYWKHLKGTGGKAK